MNLTFSNQQCELLMSLITRKPVLCKTELNIKIFMFLMLSTVTFQNRYIGLCTTRNKTIISKEFCTYLAIEKDRKFASAQHKTQ